MTGVDPAKRVPKFAFATTNWTRILAARGESIEARQALRELCEAYYCPVETFIQRTRLGAQDSRDLTHDFFAKVLAGHSFDNLQPRAGRFRSYLLGAVKHFLADHQDRQSAAKRGGGKKLQSLDNVSDSLRQRQEDANQQGPVDPSGFPADAFFDRDWAIQLLNRVLDVLASEQERGPHFRVRDVKAQLDR